MLGRTPVSPGLAISPEVPEICNGDSPGSAGWQLASMTSADRKTTVAGRMAHTNVKQAGYRMGRPDTSGLGVSNHDQLSGFGGNDVDALLARKSKYQQGYPSWHDISSGSHLAHNRSSTSADTCLMGGPESKLAGSRGADPGCSLSLDESIHHGGEEFDAGSHQWSLPPSAHALAYAPGNNGGGPDASTSAADMLRRKVRLSTSHSFSGLASAGFSGTRQASAATLASSSSYNNLTSLVHSHKAAGRHRFSDASATGDDVTVLVSPSVASHEGHGSNEWSRTSTGALLYQLSPMTDTSMGEGDGRNWRSSMETVIGGYVGGSGPDERKTSVTMDVTPCGGWGSLEEIERVGYSLECDGGGRVFIPKRESMSGRGRGGDKRAGTIGPLAALSAHGDYASGLRSPPLPCGARSSKDEIYRSSLDTASTEDRQSGGGEGHQGGIQGVGALDGFLGNMDHEHGLAVGDLDEVAEGASLHGLPGGPDPCWPLTPDVLEEVCADTDWLVPRDMGLHAQGLVGHGAGSGARPSGEVHGMTPSALGMMSGLGLPGGTGTKDQHMQPLAGARAMGQGVAPIQLQCKGSGVRQPGKSKEGDALASSPLSAGGQTTPGSASKGGSAKQAGGDKVTEKKVRVDWTPELHACFTQAVDKLGLDKAIPSEILELMGVSSLTRHNIASHLQKYRSRHRRMQSATQVDNGDGNASTVTATEIGQVSSQQGAQDSQQAGGVGTVLGGGAGGSNNRTRAPQRSKSRVSIDVTSGVAGYSTKRTKASPKDGEGALSPPLQGEEPVGGGPMRKGSKKLPRRTLSQLPIIVTPAVADDCTEGAGAGAGAVTGAAAGVCASAHPSLGHVPSCGSLEDLLPAHPDFALPDFSDGEVFLGEDDDGSPVMVEMDDADGTSLLGHGLEDAELIHRLANITSGGASDPQAGMRAPMMMPAGGAVTGNGDVSGAHVMAVGNATGMPLLMDDVDIHGARMRGASGTTQSGAPQQGPFGMMGAPAGNSSKGPPMAMMAMGSELPQQPQQAQPMKSMVGGSMGNLEGPLALPGAGEMFLAQPQQVQPPQQQQPMDSSSGFFMQQPAGHQMPMQWAPSFEAPHSGFMPSQAPQPQPMDAQGPVQAWGVAPPLTPGMFERGGAQVMMMPRRRPILPRLAPRPPAPPVIQRNPPSDASVAPALPGTMSLACGIANTNGHLAAMSLDGRLAPPQWGAPAGGNMGDRNGAGASNSFAQPGMNNAVKWGVGATAGVQGAQAGPQQSVAAPSNASSNALMSPYGPGMQWMQQLLSPSNTGQGSTPAAANNNHLPSIIQQVLLNPLTPLPVGLRSPHLEDVMVVLAKRSRVDHGNSS
eukprot:jgi/Mesvir1/7096/Mv09204-RA.1